jgi:hypothetical protein
MDEDNPQQRAVEHVPDAFCQAQPSLRAAAGTTLHLTCTMPTPDEKPPASPTFAGVRLGRLVRSKPLWALVVGALLFVSYLNRLDTFVMPAPASASALAPLPEATHEAPKPAVKEIVSSDGRHFTSGPAFPPSAWTDLRKWERELPQHNLSLPFPEGRTGRYVRFTNQVRGLGWNNVLNEMCVLLPTP